MRHRSWSLPILAAALVIGGGIRPLGAQVASEEGARPTAAIVRFRGQSLFEMRTRIGTNDPAARAALIEGRLAAIAAGPSRVLESIHVVERERTSDLFAGDSLVLSVTDGDAAPLGRTRQQLAADDAVRLHAALAREFSGRSLRGIGIGLALTLLATVILVLLYRVTGRIFPRLATAIRSWEGTVFRGLRIQRVELVSAARLTRAAERTALFARWVVLFIAFVVYLQAVLGFFPWTRGAAQQTLAYAWTAVRTLLLNIVSYLPKLVYIAIIVLLVRLVIRAARLVFDAVRRGDIHLPAFHPEWADPTFKIARFLILAFSLVVIFPYLPGSQSDAFKGVSIFLGVLLSFGSSSAIANVVAGVVLTYMMPFRPGDRVKIADTVGDVVASNLLVVRVRTIKNVEVTIPNAAVLSGHIINYSSRSREEGLILHTTVTIGYDAPWRQVHELLKKAALGTDGILPKPEPFVLQTALNDFYVSYELNAYTNQANRMAVIYGDLHQHIQDEFAQGGVEIMSPHYVAARDGNTMAVPAEQLPKGYEPPAFRVRGVEAGESIVPPAKA